MITKGMMSNNRNDWRTPKALFNVLNKEFHFDCDPCFIKKNTLHEKDMLGSDWGKCNFVNPPYNQLELWIKKAYWESKKGKVCVLLIPSRTDTRWWHNFVMKYAKEVRFVKGRLCFDDQQNPAPFPSAIVVFRGGTSDNSDFKVSFTSFTPPKPNPTDSAS